jgi:hypothetical protein
VYAIAEDTTVGIPLIAPVVELKDNPAGKLGAIVKVKVEEGPPVTLVKVNEVNTVW